MTEKKISSPVRIILSIIAGIVGAAAVFFTIILLSMATGLFGWSDGGEEKYLKRLEIRTNITLIISVISALVTGIAVIIGVNKSKI
jgi:uncharacterized membrane protein